MTKKTKIISIILVLTILVVCVAKYQEIYAYFTTKASKTNSFKFGEVIATVTEPNYKNNQILKPKEEIEKDPTLSNTGKIACYIRAQVYVPISKEVRYIDENENMIIPTQAQELLSYTINDGWEKVTEQGFNGVYADKDGNNYNVYTYKYVENGEEKLIEPGEKIDVPVFSKIKAINYADMDKNVNLNLQVSALAVQPENKNVNEIWESYANQNGTGIVGFEQ